MYMQASHYYDLFDFDLQEGRAQAAFIRSYLKGAKQALEIGAGSGTLALILAGDGVSVTCLEPSPGMRSLLISRLAYSTQLQKYVSPLPYDGAVFNLRRVFPLVYSSNVMHLLQSDDERAKILANIMRHVQPGGKVILDFRTAGLAKKEKELSGELTLGEVQYRRYTSIEPLGKDRWSYRWFFEVHHCGKIIETCEEKFQAKTERPEVCRDLLKENNISPVGEYSDYSFTPFEPSDKPSRMIIVGRKN